jgi:hypothetical protein
LFSVRKSYFTFGRVKPNWAFLTKLFSSFLCLWSCYVYVYATFLIALYTLANICCLYLLLHEWALLILFESNNVFFSLQHSVKRWLHYLPLPNIIVDVDKDKMKWHDCIIYSISPDLVCHRIFCPSFHFHLKNAFSFNLPSSQFMPFIDKVYLQQRNSKGYVKRTFRYFFWQF